MMTRLTQKRHTKALEKLSNKNKKFFLRKSEAQGLIVCDNQIR
jgi:hypothetical protein